MFGKRFRCKSGLSLCEAAVQQRHRDDAAVAGCACGCQAMACEKSVDCCTNQLKYWLSRQYSITPSFYERSERTSSCRNDEKPGGTELSDAVCNCHQPVPARMSGVQGRFPAPDLPESSRCEPPIYLIITNFPIWVEPSAASTVQ